MWIVNKNTKMQGPYSTDEVRRLLREQELSVSDLIWRSGWEHWLPIGKSAEFHPHTWSLTPEGERDLAQVVEMNPLIGDI